MNVLNLFSQQVMATKWIIIENTKLYHGLFKMNCVSKKLEHGEFHLLNVMLVLYWNCQYILLNRALTHNSSFSTKSVVVFLWLKNIIQFWQKSEEKIESIIKVKWVMTTSRNCNRIQEVPGRSRDKAGQDLETLKVPQVPGTKSSVT